MEPMDYTMDEGHSAPPHNATSRCPAMQTYQTPNSFGSRSSGDAHHYDPVHNTDIWYPGNASNGSNRHPYTAPQNISPWGHPGALNSIYSRQGFMEGHPGGLGSEGSGLRSQASFVGLPVSPWADARDSFNYGPYVHGRSSNNGLPDIGFPRTTAASSSTRTPADHTSFDQAGMLDLTSRPNQQVNSSSSTDTAHPNGRSSQTGASESRTSPVAVDQATQASPYTAAPRHSARSAHVSMAQARRRRLAAGINGLDSSSPSDSNSDEEVEILRRQRRDEELIASIHNADEERLLATMRANIAASKRVPSKEAIASIEKLDVNDLSEDQRTCIICYNDFGVVNPEGAIETPYRLPKCKHIFGDKCIKKWFEENDSCPYCRDKLPSTVNYGRSHAIEQMRMMRATQEQRAMLQQAARARNAASASRDRPNDLASRHEHRYEDYYNQLLANNSGRIMEPWNMGTTPQGDTAENRRRQSQARGRISNAQGRFGRPSSAVGSHSPRVFSNDRGNPPRGSFELHLDPSSSRPHPSFGLSANTPRRSITPGLPRPSGDASTGSATQAPTRHQSSNAQASSPEEASPAVAVGSRVSSGDQRTLLSSIGAGSFDFQPEDYQNSAFANPRWSEQFGNFLSQNDENLFSPPGSSSAAAESVYRQHLASNQIRRHPFAAMHEEAQYPTSQNNPPTESRPRLGRTTSTDPDPYHNNSHLYMPDVDQRDSAFNHSQVDSPGNDGRSPMGWPR